MHGHISFVAPPREKLIVTPDAFLFCFYHTISCVKFLHVDNMSATALCALRDENKIKIIAAVARSFSWLLLHKSIRVSFAIYEISNMFSHVFAKHFLGVF